MELAYYVKIVDSFMTKEKVLVSSLWTILLKFKKKLSNWRFWQYHLTYLQRWLLTCWRKHTQTRLGDKASLYTSQHHSATLQEQNILITNPINECIAYLFWYWKCYVCPFTFGVYGVLYILFIFKIHNATKNDIEYVNSIHKVYNGIRQRTIIYNKITMIKIMWSIKIFGLWSVFIQWMSLRRWQW